jgi:hypothetical protein
VSRFAHPSNHLHPAEAFLDSFSLTLTDLVAGVTNRTLIDSTQAHRGVLSPMGRDAQRSARSNKVLGVSRDSRPA